MDCHDKFIDKWAEYYIMLVSSESLDAGVHWLGQRSPNEKFSAIVMDRVRKTIKGSNNAK